MTTRFMAVRCGSALLGIPAGLPPEPRLRALPMEEYGDFKSRRQPTVWHSLNRLLIALIAFTVVTLDRVRLRPGAEKRWRADDRVDQTCAKQSRRSATSSPGTRARCNLLTNDPDLYRDHRPRPPRHDEGGRDDLPHRPCAGAGPVPYAARSIGTCAAAGCCPLEHELELEPLWKRRKHEEGSNSRSRVSSSHPPLLPQKFDVPSPPPHTSHHVSRPLLRRSPRPASPRQRAAEVSLTSRNSRPA